MCCDPVRSDGVCAGQAASDMWAVGALAWELLTGRPLFGDNFSDEDVVMVLLGFKPLPFEADPSLWVLFTESQVLPGYSMRTHIRVGCMKGNFIGVNAFHQMSCLSLHLEFHYDFASRLHVYL